MVGLAGRDQGDRVGSGRGGTGADELVALTVKRYV